jgi:hypothetical protein
MRNSGFIQKKSVSDRSNQFFLMCSVVVLFSILSSTMVKAQGNLLITPRRVIFEDKKRTQDLNLANTGVDTAKYNVSVIQYRMKEDGSVEEITTPDDGQNFADKFLRFFPRTVTLAPNEAQVVKMQVIKTNELKPGEYRSHVYFRAVPNESALGADTVKTDSTAIGVRLVPIFGISIPVIIRLGESTMKVGLSDLNLELVNDTTKRLKIVFTRTGNMSVYGDLLIEHISPSSKTTPVGTVRGIAVYTPNAIRKFQMDLDNTAKVDYHSGSLKVTFSTQSDTKPEKLAEAMLQLK